MLKTGRSVDLTNMNSTQQDPQDELVLELVKGYDAGKEWSEGLEPGKPFQGAMPAAIAAGFKRETPGYNMFLFSALELLDRRCPRGICVNDEGIITRMEPSR